MNRQRRRGWAGIRMLGIGGIVVVAVSGALSFGSVSRILPHHTPSSPPATPAPPRVTFSEAHAMSGGADRILPGTALPLLEASMYARATGFVKSRLVDIGDRVKEGQLLAVIDAPDIDDQLSQAKANLEQSRANVKLSEANLALAHANLARYQSANKVNAVSPQELDTQVAAEGTASAAVEAAKASVLVNEAAVQRFTDLQKFERIVAPFPGVITARQIDPGDLISADSTTRELFHLMRTDTLRVFVNVPQVFASGVKVGQTATVFQRERPARKFAGKVTRTADALDQNSRTLSTEVQVPNPDNLLRPGMYLQVEFNFARPLPPLMIPSAALATRTGAPRVGVVDDNNRVHYRTVQLGRDYGAEIQVLSGLSAGEKVIVYPGDDLADGTEIEPVPLTK